MRDHLVPQLHAFQALGYALSHCAFGQRGVRLLRITARIGITLSTVRLLRCCYEAEREKPTSSST